MLSPCSVSAGRYFVEKHRIAIAFERIDMPHADTAKHNTGGQIVFLGHSHNTWLSFIQNIPDRSSSGLARKSTSGSPWKNGKSQPKTTTIRTFMNARHPNKAPILTDGKNTNTAPGPERNVLSHFLFRIKAASHATKHLSKSTGISLESNHILKIRPVDRSENQTCSTEFVP